MALLKQKTTIAKTKVLMAPCLAWGGCNAAWITLPATLSLKPEHNSVKHWCYCKYDHTTRHILWEGISDKMARNWQSTEHEYRTLCTVIVVLCYVSSRCNWHWNFFTNSCSTWKLILNQHRSRGAYKLGVLRVIMFFYIIITYYKHKFVKSLSTRCS